MVGRSAKSREESLALFPQISFEIGGRVMRRDARDCNAVPFETCTPVRTFPAWPGKKNYSGLYWSATMSDHIGFESLTEKTALMILDRDPDVVAISSQPMWLSWPTTPKATFHAPDYFVRHTTGSATVIDVRPEAMIDEQTRAVFAATQELCASIGFGYQVLSEFSLPLTRNLSFLARFRSDARTRVSLPEELADHLRLSTWRLQDIARELGGDDLASGVSMTYQLIWDGALVVDLGQPLSLRSVAQLPDRSKE